MCRFLPSLFSLTCSYSRVLTHIVCRRRSELDWLIYTLPIMKPLIFQVSNTLENILKYHLLHNAYLRYVCMFYVFM